MSFLQMALLENLELRTLLAAHGLNATYFDSLEFSGPSVMQIDSRIDFDWGKHRRPTSGIRGKTYSVRWNGLLQSRAAGTYTFRVRNNDGGRVWLDGNLLIDNWSMSPRQTRSGSIALKAKTHYDLRVEYFDQDRTAAIQMRWLGPGFSEEVVPGQRMYPYDQRFAAIGDYGRTNDYAQGTARLVNSWAPNFIITLGDNNYDSGSAGTIDANIGKFYHWYIGNYHGGYVGAPRSNHFFPALGNHDWTPAGSVSPYKDYFTLPGNERYYDFTQGPLHFFALDSDVHEPDGVSPNSKQGQWLHAALTASTSLYNVVYFHHSPFSSGEHGDASWMQWPFKDWGADIVLSGHDHEYERLSEGGLTYVVSGTGAGPSSFGNSFRAGSLTHDDSDSGALLIQANDLAMTFQYQLRSGRIVDTFTIPPSA